MAYLREEELTEMFSEAVQRLKIPQQVIDWTKNELEALHTSYAEEQKANIDRLNTPYHQLNAFIDQSYNDKLEGAITPQMWQD